MTKPKVAGDCMGKKKVLTHMHCASKGIGTHTKQSHTRGNKVKTQKICVRHTQVQWHKICTRTHKTRNKITIIPNPNRKTNKNNETTNNACTRVAQATQQQNKKNVWTKPATKTGKNVKKNVCRTQQTVTQNFSDTHECSKHNKSIRKGKILATRTHMAEAKHTEIAQNLLIKVQPRKVKKKKQTQNPTQTKLIWIYIPNQAKKNRHRCIYSPQQEFWSSCCMCAKTHVSRAQKYALKK